MCIFSREVKSVSATKIFASIAYADLPWIGPGRRPYVRQTLVYENQYAASDELAMVLPIPAALGSSSIELIDMSSRRKFFEALEALFSDPYTKSLGGRGRFMTRGGPLPVISCGDYLVSICPRQEDMKQLHPMFQVDSDIWDDESLQHYRSYSFVVAKLKAGTQKMSPLAFSFVSKLASAVYFPTLHVHDGRLPARAEFDHTLYLEAPPYSSVSQLERDSQFEAVYGGPGEAWELYKGWRIRESDVSDPLEGFLHNDRHLTRRVINGEQHNGDILVPLEN